ncbi:MAG: nucleoside 2-deoxyribosyltransferase domain-containing protein [Gemmataceae bacterium]
MARIIKPPAPVHLDAGVPSVFLAGSIEQGAAEDWQRQVEFALDDLPVVILNPRRDEWDASWVQSIDNPQFRGQVEWELAAQERAGVIGMYFAPATRAPITLLELGLFARSGKVVVCCPDGYWRKGNVEIVCARYSVPLVPDLTDLVRLLRERVTSIMTPGAPATE